MKRFALTVLVLGVTAAAVAYLAGSREVAMIRATAVGTLTLFAFGVTYVAIYAVRMRQLEISAKELTDDEVVWAKTSHAVHYKSGNPYKFWEAVGGKLFLTSEALEFRANPAEWWVYQIRIPLRSVHRAEPCKIGFVPGGLRVEREDGTAELFTFGAAFDVSREWADAILDFRDDLAEDGPR